MSVTSDTAELRGLVSAAEERVAAQVRAVASASAKRGASIDSAVADHAPRAVREALPSLLAERLRRRQRHGRLWPRRPHARHNHTIVGVLPSTPAARPGPGGPADRAAAHPASPMPAQMPVYTRGMLM